MNVYDFPGFFFRRRLCRAVENVRSLTALTELNLRRNSIERVSHQTSTCSCWEAPGEEQNWLRDDRASGLQSPVHGCTDMADECPKRSGPRQLAPENAVESGQVCVHVHVCSLPTSAGAWNSLTSSPVA